jgi:peptidoglycan/LPS O-acetylase OafA/YrhL
MAVGLARLEFQGFLFHFSLGILLAAVYHHDRVGRVCKSRLFLFSAFAAGFLLYASRFLGLGLEEKWIWPLTGLGSALLILCALYSEVGQRVLTKAPLVSLGRISYGLCLLHFAVLLVVAPRVLAGLNRLGITGAPAWIFGLFGTLVCSLALAYLSERWIEVPFIRIGKRLRAYWRI